MRNKFKQLFTLALFASTCQLASAYDFVVNGIYYNIISSADKTVEVAYKYKSSSNANTYVGDITIPQTVSYNGNEYSVERIGEYAFYYCSNLTSVTWSNCTSIGGAAFAGCSSLTSVGDLSSCTIIGNYAFEDCSSLTSVGDLSACTSIGSEAFYGCRSLTSIGDLSSCTSIGGYTFSGCSSLTNVDLSSCTSIDDGVFGGCSLLTSVGDLSSCTSIGSSAFNNCSSLTSVGDLSSCTSIGFEAFYNCSSLTSFTIPASVLSIGDNAFFGCSGIKSLTIEDGTEDLKLGKYRQDYSSYGMFYIMPLETLYLGRTLISDYGPFRWQQNLTDVQISNTVKSIGFEAFYNCSLLTNVDLSSCTSIGGSAFCSCTSLTSVGDLSSCTSIGSEAFSGCSSLTSVGDLSACSNIGNNAFQNCSSLTSVGDLSACSNIGNNAFLNCRSLTSVGDLSSCTSIGSSAFSGCTSLPRVSISAVSVASLYSTNAFEAVTTILVPNNLLADYKSADVWKDMASRIIAIGSEPAVVQHVTMQDNWSGIYAAIGEENLANVIELKVIGDINSYDIGIIRDKMPNLHYLDLSEARIRANDYKYYSNYSTKDDELGSYAFYQMYKLIKVTLPETLKVISSYSFSECSNLQEVKIGMNTTTIYSYAFYKCSSLKSVVISPESRLNTINASAFLDCKKLSSIELPASLTTIGPSAFSGCSSLQSVVFAPCSNLKTIDGSAFGGCSKLSSVELPASLTTIGVSAFANCTSLQSVLFAPNSKLSSVGTSAFYYCSQLPSIELPSTVTTIGTNAFQYCSALSEIYLPASLKSVGNNAFYGCTNLRSVYATAPNAYDVTIVDETFTAATREQGTLYVPFDEETGWDATYKTYYWQTQWKRFLNIAKWRPMYDRFPIDNDYDQTVGTIPGDEIDAEFGTNAGYILGEEAWQSFKTVEIKCNGSKGGSIIVKGDKNISIGELLPEIEVSGNKWYFFCFPFDIKLSDVTCGVDGRFVFRKYNSEARAEGGTGWTNLAANEEWLKAGVGYIFQCNKSGTLRLPIVDPEFTDTDKSPVLETHLSDELKDASWNFVGNPYLAYYQLEDLGYTAPVTYWNGSSYVAVRPGDDDYVFQPYQAFFVQKPTDAQTVGFDGAQQQTYTQSQKALTQARERRAQKRVNPDRMIVNVTLSDGEHSDQTRVVYNNAASVGYEMQNDAAKFMSTESVPQLFTVNGTVQYAINERPQGEVQLGFKAPQAGTYTIRMARMDTPMLLKDLKTGITFDFTVGENYVFEAEAGTNIARFVLLPNPNANRIENMTIADAENAQFYNLAGQLTDGESDAIQIMKQGETAKKVMIK